MTSSSALAKRLGAWCLLLLLACPGWLGAMDLQPQAGITQTQWSFPLTGGSVGLALVGEAKGWTPEAEFLGHHLIGQEGDVEVTLQSFDATFYLHWAVSKGFLWGPGIGYGVASITEKGGEDYQNPTVFFTGQDIHYGQLALKASIRGEAFFVNLRAASLGGLVGLGVLCGYSF